MTAPDLPTSLTARVLLLFHEDTQHRLISPRLFSYQGMVVRATVLTDLYLRGALTDADGRAVADRTVRFPDDPLLALVHQEILDAAKPMKWKKLVNKRNRPTLAAAREQLAAEGLARVTTSRTLGLFPTTKVEVRAPRAQAALRGVVERALGSTPVSRLEPRDAALAALVVVGRLRWIVPAREVRRAKKRVDQLMIEAGPALPALRSAIRDIEASSAA